MWWEVPSAWDESALPRTSPPAGWAGWEQTFGTVKVTNGGWQSCLLRLGPLTSGMLVKEKNFSLDLRRINTGNRNHSSEQNGIEYIKSEEGRGPILTSKNYSQNVTKMILHGKHYCHYQVQYTATLPQRTTNANGQKANASLSLTYSLSGKAPHTPSRRPWSRDATPAEGGVQQLNTVGLWLQQRLYIN